jgi:hypothetical protein
VIVLKPISEAEESTTDAEAKELQQAWVSGLNNGTSTAVSNPASPIVLKSPSLTFYCSRQVSPLKEVELYCEAAKFPYRLHSLGPVWSEKEIESVLSSFE